VELNRRADLLAHHLELLGVKADMPVGICLERSLELMVGLLGILKAGGAYVPLDPAYPRERLALMLENAQATVLVTQQASFPRCPQRQGQWCAWTCLCQLFQDPKAGLEIDPRQPGLCNLHLGLDGEPKGVAMEHRPW